MPIEGPIYALDLATRTGWAFGPAGVPPASGSVVLKKTSEHRAVAFSNLIAFLNEAFTQERPSLVVKESMFTLQANATANGGSEVNIRMHAGLHAIVEGMCGRFGINWEEVGATTHRKHFTGRGVWADREEGKRETVIRAHLLGLMPKDNVDDNRADAISVHDWACATYCGRAAFALTQQTQPRKRHV
jgi:hypothetical protein